MTSAAEDLAGLPVAFNWNGTVMADTGRASAAANAVLASRGIDVLTREGLRLPLAGWPASLGVPETEAAWNTAMTARPARARPEAAAPAALHGATPWWQ